MYIGCIYHPPLSSKVSATCSQLWISTFDLEDEKELSEFTYSVASASWFLNAEDVHPRPALAWTGSWKPQNSHEDEESEAAIPLSHVAGVCSLSGVRRVVVVTTKSRRGAKYRLTNILGSSVVETLALTFSA